MQNSVIHVTYRFIFSAPRLGIPGNLQGLREGVVALVGSRDWVHGPLGSLPRPEALGTLSFGRPVPAPYEFADLDYDPILGYVVQTPNGQNPSSKLWHWGLTCLLIASPRSQVDLGIYHPKQYAHQSPFDLLRPCVPSYPRRPSFSGPPNRQVTSAKFSSRPQRSRFQISVVE